MMAGVLGRGLSQTRCSESPEENRVPLHNESQDQDGGGFLFESKWKLGEDLGIGYIIRFDIKDPSPDHQIEVDDVFVDLDEAVKLLSCVSKGSKVTIKPPKIQSIWTIRIEDEERDFCPLTEFVYHAALKATGKKFRRVYNGILSSIISNLYRSREYENKNRPVLKSYSEKNEMLPKGKEEEEEAFVKCELREDDEPMNGVGWSDVEDFLDKENEGNADGDQMKDDDVKIEADDDNYGPTPAQEPKSRRKKLKTDYSDNDFINDDEEEKEDVEPKKPRKKRTTTPEKEKSLVSGPGRHPKGASPIKGNLADIHERQTIKTEEGEMFVCGLSLCGHQFERFLSLVEHERSHLDGFI